MSTSNMQTKNSRSAWFVPAVAVVAALAVGIWVFGALINDFTTSMALTAAWFVVVAIAVLVAGKRFPRAKVALRGTFAAVAVASVAGFYWTSVRDDTVNEVVVAGVAASQVPAATPSPSPTATAPTAAPAPAAAPTPSQNIEVARGVFETRAHTSRGKVAVVKLASGGRKLTFTDFETDNGPDLRVYLVKGPVNGDGDVKDTVDLGRLKGNVGNQQYDIPDNVDISAYSTVLIWCRAFTVSFAQADLATA